MIILPTCGEGLIGTNSDVSICANVSAAYSLSASDKRSKCYNNSKICQMEQKRFIILVPHRSRKRRDHFRCCNPHSPPPCTLPEDNPECRSACFGHQRHSRVKTTKHFCHNRWRHRYLYDIQILMHDSWYLMSLCKTK